MQILIPKSIVFSSSSLTLFFSFLLPFSLPFPNIRKWEVLGRNLGGTWEERFRFTFVTSLLSNRYQSEVLSKTKRSSIEDLSNIYRRPIEDLSNIYRRPIEEGVKREQRGSRGRSRVGRGTFTLPSHGTVLDSLPSHGSSC